MSRLKVAKTFLRGCDQLTPRSYNKQEADFATREEYDEYLEEREDISASLALSFCCWLEADSVDLASGLQAVSALVISALICC